MCQLYEMMILQLVCQLYDKLNTWQKERMKDITITTKNNKKGKYIFFGNVVLKHSSVHTGALPMLFLSTVLP